MWCADVSPSRCCRPTCLSGRSSSWRAHHACPSSWCWSSFCWLLQRHHHLQLTPPIVAAARSTLCRRLPAEPCHPTSWTAYRFSRSLWRMQAREPLTLRTRTPILGDLWRSFAIFTARSLAILADLWRSFRSEKYLKVRRGNERSLAIFGDPCGCARIARDRQGSAGIALRITAPAIQRPLAPPQFSAPTSNSAAPNPGSLVRSP